MNRAPLALVKCKSDMSFYLQLKENPLLKVKNEFANKENLFRDRPLKIPGMLTSKLTFKL